MKILQLAPRLPYPPDEGGKIGIFNITKYLALRGHHITLVFPVYHHTQLPTELTKYCTPLPIVLDTRTKIRGLLRNILMDVPYTIAKYHSPKIINTLDELLKKEEFDLAHVDHLHMAYYGLYLKQKFGLPTVLREHNVETIIMERFYKNQTNFLFKLYAYLQYCKLRRYESHICGQFDRCLMITKEDERRLHTMNSLAKTVVVSAGVDTEYFHPMEEIKEEPYSLVSVASLDWLPNVEGILWFYNKIWPVVKKKVPKAKLYLIGKNPPSKIRALEREGVIVTGFIEDVREYIAKAAVFLVPLRIGGGMRIKILNALAMGKAVISTSIGAEGIDVTDGRDIYLADTAEEFAQKIIELLNDEDKRRRIGKEGLKLVKEKYQWEHVAEQIEEEYKKILKEKGS